MLCNGTRAAAAASKIRKCSAQDALVINAAMLIKAIIFNRQYRFFNHIRDVFDMHQTAALLAEFTDEDAVCRKNSEWNFGAIVRQRVERGKVGPSQREHKSERQGANCKDAHQHAEKANKQP